MPNLKAIRKRISSVKSTQQITKAMKMVAAAKLRRAQEAIVQARPYAIRLVETIGQLASRAEGDAHELLIRRPVKKAMLLVVTSDRGLCGGFNTNIARAAQKTFAQRTEEGQEVAIATIGRKAKEYFAHRGYTLDHVFADVWPSPGVEKAREVARTMVEGYLSGGFDELVIIYNEFKSAISQKVVTETLLPIEPEEVEGLDFPVDYIYEPDRDTMLGHILPLFVDIQIYRALLESQASEMGARMTAMEAATSNAAEMISDLTLLFNRARQAAITSELIEIISGAEAL